MHLQPIREQSGTLCCSAFSPCARADGAARFCLVKRWSFTGTCLPEPQDEDASHHWQGCCSTEDTRPGCKGSSSVAVSTAAGKGSSAAYTVVLEQCQPAWAGLNGRLYSRARPQAQRSSGGVLLAPGRRAPWNKQNQVLEDILKLATGRLNGWLVIS